MPKYIYGVDLGGTNIKIGLFRKEKVVLVNKVQVSTPKENQEETIFLKIVDTIEKMNKDNNISYSDVYGIGIAVPCPVVDGRVTVCPNISLRNLSVNDKLANLVPKHVKIVSSNDANMAALGEFVKARENYSNAAFYTLGTGVGGGLIVDGKIVEGKQGTAGEFGHIKVFEGQDVLCGCGSNGCLEQLAGTVGLLRLVKRYTVYEPSILEKDNITVKDIFDAARKGDIVGQKVTDRALEALAISASIIAVISDPDVFIIGGGVSNAGQYLIDRLTYFYKKHARFNTGEIPFILAKLKNDAGIYGAAHHLMA